MISAYKEMYAKLPTQFQLEAYEESCLGNYVCDTLEDLKNLPDNCVMGSTARVISPLTIYRKNFFHQQGFDSRFKIVIQTTSARDFDRQQQIDIVDAGKLNILARSVYVGGISVMASIRPNST